MRARGTAISVVAATVWALSTARAQAQIQTYAPVDERPPLGIFPAPADALMDPRVLRSWGDGPARDFVATTVDVGFVYFRPRVALGYGKPFTSWVGVEGNPIVTNSELAVYGGVRLELPYFDLRAGPRFFRAFDHTYLPDQPSFTRLELDTGSGPVATATTYEVETDLSVPAGPGAVVGRGSLSYVTGVPEGDELFEETLHVIVRPPWIWRGRLGFPCSGSARTGGTPSGRSGRSSRGAHALRRVDLSCGPRSSGSSSPGRSSCEGASCSHGRVQPGHPRHRRRRLRGARRPLPVGVRMNAPSRA